MHTVMVCLFFCIYTSLGCILSRPSVQAGASPFWNKFPVQREFQCEKTLMNPWNTIRYVFGIEFVIVNVEQIDDICRYP